MTSQITRVAQLPGYDTAPDVYETAELEDDATTQGTLQTSPREPSQASDTSDDGLGGDDDEEYYGVSRRRLYPERARSRFGAASRGVETRGVDLSDRIDGRRRGYRVRRGDHGDDSDGAEDLRARIARLKREIEECKVLAEQEADGGEATEEGQDGLSTDADALSSMLAGIELPSKTKTMHSTQRDQESANAQGLDLDDEQSLSRVSAFDARLAALETSLGIASIDDPSSAQVTLPLLPSLSLLDTQLATLTSANSLANLEAAHSKIQSLKLEARNLASLQSTALHAVATTNGDISEYDEDGSASEAEPKNVTALSPDDMKLLQSLYTLIPTLQALAPTVPSLINRLRSLRTLHSAAANVNSELESIEQRQELMEKDLKIWRDGLEKVEKAVNDADQANGRNGAMVKEWVDALEKRVTALGR